MNFLPGKIEVCTNLFQNPSVGGQCIVLIRKFQDDTNNLIETAFLHISMVQRKIDNNVAVYEYFGRNNGPLHQFIVKSLRRRAMHCFE